MAADISVSNVAHTTSSNTTVSTTGIDTTGALIFEVGCAWYGTGSAPTVSDSKANTWTSSQLGSTLAFAADANAKTAAYRIVPSSVGTGHTFTITFGAAQDVMTLFIAAITGSAGSFDDGTPAGLEDTASAFVSNSITTTNASDVLVAFTFTFTSGGTETLDWTANSFTQVQQQNDGNAFAGALAKRLVSSTGAYQSSFTSSGAGTSAAITYLHAIKSAAAAATSNGGKDPTRQLFDGTLPHLRMLPRGEQGAQQFLRAQQQRRRRAYGFAVAA
jgi:hypothetical protein